MFRKLIKDYKENKEINEKYRKIKQKYDKEFDADPSNIMECYMQLRTITKKLSNELFPNKTADEMGKTLEAKIITTVLEEKLVSIGSNPQAYIEWKKEELEIEEERKKTKKIEEEIKKLDRQTVLDVEKRIRKEFDKEFDADPSNLEECYEQLDDIEFGLRNDLLVNKELGEVLWLLESRTISKVLEEKLVSIGGSLEAYYEWMETEDDDLENEEENMDYEDNGISSNHHIR